jgi:hypothetical protein
MDRIDYAEETRKIKLLFEGEDNYSSRVRQGLRELVERIPVGNRRDLDVEIYRLVSLKREVLLDHFSRKPRITRGESEKLIGMIDYSKQYISDLLDVYQVQEMKEAFMGSLSRGERE